MKFSTISICALGLMLSACSTVTPLQAKGAKVLATSTTPPATCHFLKALSLTSTNGFDSAYRSHQAIQADQLNQLRNMTADLGGNVFVIHEHDTSYQSVSVGDDSARQVIRKESAATSDNLVDKHKMAGSAYLCDSADLAAISARANTQAQAKLNDVTVVPA